ncbi:MAG: phage holin family protein [Peptococcaceae bacterium]|nr:phage holin family protein [Peptococcaceae bacterium]
MGDLGFVSVPSIVVICYLAGMIMKVSPLDSRFIPCMCGLLGGILGVIAFFFIPEIIAEDALTSVAMGIVSGLAATGAHQVGVQLSENKKKEDIPTQNDISSKSN